MRSSAERPTVIPASVKGERQLLVLLLLLLLSSSTHTEKYVSHDVMLLAIDSQVSINYMLCRSSFGSNAAGPTSNNMQ